MNVIRSPTTAAVQDTNVATTTFSLLPIVLGRVVISTYTDDNETYIGVDAAGNAQKTSHFGSSKGEEALQEELCVQV